MTTTLRATIVLGTAAAFLALAPLGASATPALTSAWTNTAPVIDGVRSANEWTGTATPLVFRWPGMTVRGVLWTQWRDGRLYLAADIDQGELANELDVVIDENNDGRLQTGEPAYLAWASGFSQQFSYDARRHGFAQDPRGTRREFRSASRRNGSARTFEYAIAIDPSQPVRIALKLEHGGKPGQFDTWPTAGSRDPITRNPHEWARLTFTPYPYPPIPTYPPAPVPPAVPAPLPPTPTPVDRTPPQVALVLSPTTPTAQQEVSWYATATDASGIGRIELRLNGSLIRSCAAATCETRTGPYVNGTAVSVEAWAYDLHGNVAVAGRTIAVAAAPPTDQQPPGMPQQIQVINPGTGNSLFLFWVNPPDTDFTKVRIYRSTVAGAPGILVASPTVAPYADAGLTEGVTYWYTIRAVDASGNESVAPAQVTGAPRRP